MRSAQSSLVFRKAEWRKALLASTRSCERSEAILAMTECEAMTERTTDSLAADLVNALFAPRRVWVKSGA